MTRRDRTEPPPCEYKSVTGASPEELADTLTQLSREYWHPVSGLIVFNGRFTILVRRVAAGGVGTAQPGTHDDD